VEPATITKSITIRDLVRTSNFDSREDAIPGESASSNRLAHRVVERLCDTRHSLAYMGGEPVVRAAAFTSHDTICGPSVLCAKSAAISLGSTLVANSLYRGRE
jgi:chorismate-pyruvate lyase